MNVVVIAPHPDDESIGCGGALCAHRERGDRVSVLFLTSGERGLQHLPADEARSMREREAGHACDVLGVAAYTFLRLPDWMLWANLPGVVEGCAQLLGTERPQLVYIPHPNEWHPDHQVCLSAVRRAAADLEMPACRLRLYEIWTPLQICASNEDITRHIKRKMMAIRCYQSQLAQFSYDAAISGLNRYRAIMVNGARFAEAFDEMELSQPPSNGRGASTR